MKRQCIGYKKKACGQPQVADNLCKNCIGKKFEDDVAEVFRLMGCKVQQDEFKSNRQTDIYVESSNGIFKTRAIVECKYHSTSNVQSNEVNQLVSITGPLLRNRDIDNAYLISTIGFAPSTKANARENGIECFTYDQLISKLIDFKPYLKQQIENFERDPLFDTYVDLNIERFHVNRKQKKLPLGLHSSSWMPVKNKLTKYLNRWINSLHSEHISILGDFGTGKTSFSKYYSYLLAKRYLADSVRHKRIPLLIRLSNFSRLEKGGVKAMITDFLVNECNLKTNYNCFQKLIEMGKFLLILDGFDEMSMQVDEKTRINNFQLLSSLAAENNKVILTGRPNYFPSLNKMRRAFGNTNPKDSIYDKINSDLIKKTTKSLSFEMIMLLPFSKKQINNFISKQSTRLKRHGDGCDDWSNLKNLIFKTYNLEDLAKRPVLLDIIVQTIPKIQSNVSDINLYRLYEVYTNFWINREWSKGDMRHLLTNDERLLFMQSIAMELYQCNTQSIHYSEIPEFVQKYFNLESKTKIDYFEHDVRTCTFLNRSDNGSYKFTHKSFLEFFVASKCIAELHEGDLNFVARLNLTNEVIDFISGKIKNEVLHRIAIDLKQICNKTLTENVFRIYAKLNDNIFNSFDFSGLDFRGMVFENFKFRECLFNRAFFDHAKLYNTQFHRCSLRKASFRHVCFGSEHYYVNKKCTTAGIVSFYGSDLTGSNFRGERFIKSNFSNVIFNKANFQNAAFLDCNLKNSSFKRTNLNSTLFSECQFNNTTFLSAYMRRSKFVKHHFKDYAKFGYRRSCPKRFSMSNDFRHSKFDSCNLKQAKLIGQTIKLSRFTNTDFSSARIVGTSYVLCSLERATFLNSDIVGCNFINCRNVEISFNNSLIKRSKMINNIESVL